MLDNVLDVTAWPLERQREEAANKRRVGLGFTGLGDALCMLRLRYDRPEATAMGARISEFMRDTAYLASVELAKERGAFPLFNAELYLSGGNFASRLPADDQGRNPQARPAQLAPAVDRADRHHLAGLRRQRLERHRTALLLDLQPQEAHGRRHAQGIRRRGLRLAPLQAPGRRRREAARLLRHRARNLGQAHKDMVAAVAPYIDTSISKTVNVPADYPYEDFQDLYMSAWKSGLKGLATYRPNSVLGSVLSVETAKQAEEKKQPQDFVNGDANRRLSIKNLPAPVLSSLRWPGRPNLPEGNMAWTYMIDHDARQVRPLRRPHRAGRPLLAVRSLGQRPGAAARPRRRRQDAVDGHARQRPRLAGAQARIAGQDAGGEGFEMPFPPHGEHKRMPSVVSAMAQLIQFRVEQLGFFSTKARRRCSTRCSASRSRRPAPTARCPGPSTSSTRRPAKTSSSASRKSPCPTASPAPTRCGSPATTRAPSTA
jgi:ribonucleoside-diphosphate reductase alpha chain